MDSDWVLMFSISWKKNCESDSNDIVSLCLYIAVVRTLLLFNIENDFFNYIFIATFIVIVLGVNGPLEWFLKDHVTVKTGLMYHFKTVHVSDSSNTELTWVKLQDILQHSLFCNHKQRWLFLHVCLFSHRKCVTEGLRYISWDISCSFNRTQEAWGSPVPR